MNEIGMFSPIMESLDIEGKMITGDSLSSQGKPVHYQLQTQDATFNILVGRGFSPPLNNLWH